MHIKLSPQRRDDTLTVSRQGDTLIINGQTFDLWAIPDGATLPADAIDCEYIISDVERIDGVLHLTLVLPHGANAPEETRFPEPILVTEDGEIELPPYDEEE